MNWKECVTGHGLAQGTIQPLSRETVENKRILVRADNFRAQI